MTATFCGWPAPRGVLKFLVPKAATSGLDPAACRADRSRSTDLIGQAAVVTGGATLVGRGDLAALARVGATVMIAVCSAAASEPAWAGLSVTFRHTDNADLAAPAKPTPNGHRRR